MQTEEVEVSRCRNLYPLYEVLFSTAVRKAAVSVTANAGNMRLLISQRQNSALCCFEKCVARPFVQGESKRVVNALLVPSKGKVR